MPLLRLSAPEILEITGADAVVFAQSQFCNDVALLEPNAWQWNAWLNPQGRVRWFFHLLRLGEDRLVVILRGGSASELKTALQPYVFRSKLTLTSQSNWQAHGVIGSEAIAHLSKQIFGKPPPEARGIAVKEDRYGLCMPGVEPRLLIVDAGNNFGPDAIADAAAAEAWRKQDILAGLVEIDTGSADQFLPQMLGFERIHAISFRKGCYPGQEVMARLHFKGGNKRSLYRIEFPAATAVPGTILRSAEEPDDIAGAVLNGAETGDGRSTCLAVIRESLVGNQLELETNKKIKLEIIKFN